jgi:tetratricopeptide (TPR) repeat protein
MADENEIEDNAEELFDRGVRLLKRGETLGALPFIEKSFALRETAECRSYLGLLKAIERGKTSEGVALCTAAIEEEPDNPIFYLNLGKVLYKGDRKKEAIDTVRKGLYLGNILYEADRKKEATDNVRESLYRQYHEEAQQWLDYLGLRKKPVLPFLPRQNLINKYVGIILRKLTLR